MYTKSLTHQSVTTLDISNDLVVIGRLLIAAAINPRFCAKLLNEPEGAVRDGFGGEKFHITDATMKIMTSIRGTTLPEFIQHLDSGLGKRLLMSEQFETHR